MSENREASPATGVDAAAASGRAVAETTPVSRNPSAATPSDGHHGSGQHGGGPHGGGHHSGLFTRMREAAGTVYGDIGTSVLYTVMEIVRETIRLKHHHEPPDLVDAMIAQGGTGLLSDSELIGSLSLVYWALIFLTIKYDLLIMRADNHGEGGTFALWGLLKGYTGRILGLSTLSFLVVAAAGLLAADGIITPPISMLGAYEPLGENIALLATLVSLFVLFKPQWRGTSQIGGLFGWFMLLVWFPWIALKGLPWMLRHPEVFQALN
ncbi:MAG: KUP/HAK/KT family potassium transporter, partial [Planctomycetaceae bacterium]